MLRARSAFTLVELLVATLLIDVALLALVASGALVVRQTNESHVRAAAVRAAVDRLETLAARFPCTTAGGQAIGPHAIRESWTVRRIGAAEREIVDTVRFAQTSGTQTFVLGLRAPC
jgi:Tfp pilus assembly protein PilV